MAARRTFRAELIRDGETITTALAYAWNSAVRRSEGLVRAHARTNGEPYAGDTPQVTGGKPAAPGAEYVREWSGMRTGERVSVRVAELVGVEA